MAKRGKKYVAAREKVSSTKKYALTEAVALAKQVSYSGFIGSLELHIKTNANPKYNDQLLRGTVVLPHGTGKSIKVAVFAGEDQREAAKQAGADIVGSDNLIAEIEKGTITFDVLVTTNDMMRDLAKVAKILGPKGLMPSPKAGTVTTNLSQTLSDIKKGRVEFKLDKTGNVHVGVGKLSFSDEQLVQNIDALLKAVMENKPSGVKGKLIEKVVLAPTMWPGIVVAYSE